MAAKVSVIIPAYNVDSLISMGLDSILGQTLSDVEVVIINDGSTDNTGNIADDYAQRDRRVRVIHTENRGPSHARQTGAAESTGDYLYFMDSDDILPLNALELLYEAAFSNNSSIVCGNYLVGSKESSQFTIVKRHLPANDNISALKETLAGNYGYMLWSRLIDRRFYRQVIKEAPKYFPGDDGIVWVQLLANADKVVHIDHPVHCYITRDNSVSMYNTSWSRDYRMKYIYHFRWIAHYIKNIPAIASDKDTLSFFYLYMWANLLSKNSGGVSDDEKDMEEEVYSVHYKNRRARKQLKRKLPKLWVYLCAEKNIFMRAARDILWGSGFSRTTVRKLHKILAK